MSRKLGSVLILICLVVMMVLPYFPFPEGVETGARLAVLAFVVAIYLSARKRKPTKQPTEDD